MDFLKFINTEQGKFLLETFGERIESPIIKVMPYGFVEKKEPRLYKATLFSGNSIGDILFPLYRKLRLEPQRDALDELNLIKKYGLDPEFYQYYGVMFASATLNPASGQNSPVDGRANRSVSSETFATIRGGAGTFASATENSATNLWYLDTSSTTDQFANMIRSFFGFNTSVIGGSGTLDTATFSAYITGKTSTLDINMGIYKGTLASNADVVTGDYAGTVGNTTAWSDTAPLVSAVSTSSYLDFALNATGIAGVDKSGVTIIGGRSVNDASNSAPSWSSSVVAQLAGNFADVGSNLPKLAITYTPGVEDTGGVFILS